MIWNLEKKLLIAKISLANISAHSLAYMHDYKALAVATFGNEINVYTIHNDDVSLIGHFFGHITTVTAIAALDGKLNNMLFFRVCALE